MMWGNEARCSCPDCPPHMFSDPRWDMCGSCTVMGHGEPRVELARAPLVGDRVYTRNGVLDPTRRRRATRLVQARRYV